MRLALFSVLLLVATPAMAAEANAPAAVAAHQTSVDALLAADRGFSAAGSQLPVAEAIAAAFDDDVMMPVPTGGFAKGKAAALAALRANPANLEARAEWAPVRGGISADGLHGFTYGFMTLREAGKPDARAKYLAYWIRRPEGWRIAAYKRARSAPGAVSTALRAAAIPTWSAAPNPEAFGEHSESVAAAERAFSDRAQQIGVGPAFAEFGSADAMNMGPGPDFLFGNREIAKAVGGPEPEAKATIHWGPDEGALAASSGDLGVTFGYIRPHVAPPAGQPAAIPFFTVWRKAAPGQPWRYVAE